MKSKDGRLLWRTRYDEDIGSTPPRTFFLSVKKCCAFRIPLDVSRTFFTVD